MLLYTGVHVSRPAPGRYHFSPRPEESPMSPPIPIRFAKPASSASTRAWTGALTDLLTDLLTDAPSIPTPNSTPNRTICARSSRARRNHRRLIPLRQIWHFGLIKKVGV